MAPTTTMTIRLFVSLNERLAALAKATDRSQTFWASQAIAAAIQEADQPEALFLDHQEVLSRIEAMKKGSGPA